MLYLLVHICVYAYMRMIDMLSIRRIYLITLKTVLQVYSVLMSVLPCCFNYELIQWQPCSGFVTLNFI